MTSIGVGAAVPALFYEEAAKERSQAFEVYAALLKNQLNQGALRDLLGDMEKKCTGLKSTMKKMEHQIGAASPHDSIMGLSEFNSDANIPTRVSALEEMV